ncbi:hypothetical protein IV203_016428 [Nitzschia inconspicua]|uniref:Uncharacterized protein n=1 Tax=Nitzschia inconspicua TaxID=303405 RepID=A0A9K3KPR0_9STRA|nr:hypothetical protein IV203_016428 [Nitzschia inconspicua]
MPAPPGNVIGEEDASFASLQESLYWSEFFVLPEGPSLRLSEDDFFFQLIRGNEQCKEVSHGDQKTRSRVRFFHTVPMLRSVWALDEEDENVLEHSLANKPVPTCIRKTEIELVQRHLPRYPSQTHRTKASFYPLVQCNIHLTSSDNARSFRDAKFLAFYRSRLQARKQRITDRKEKRRLLREKRFAAREAKRKSRENIVKMRGRNKFHQESAVEELSVPRTVVMTGFETSPCSLEKSKQGGDIETSLQISQSSLERGIHSSNDSSMLSSVGSFSDEEFLEKSLGDDEYFNEELDYFYAGEKQKMQQVHSRNIEDAEREQRERRLEAERKARIAMEEATQKEEEDFEETRALYHSGQLACRLESYSVRLAIFLANKRAEDQVREEKSSKLSIRPPWSLNDQYNFLRGYFSDRRALKQQFSRKQPVSNPLEEEDVMSDLNDQVTDEDSAVETPKLISRRSLSGSFRESVSCNLDTDEIEMEQYEPQVGVVPPSLQALILQAQVEMRSRKVPEEHRKKFVPSSLEASEIGRFTRLKEYVVEAYGTKQQEIKPQLPSEIWKHGKERVCLPKVEDAIASKTFTIFTEAAALGRIKALKPQVVTNYDPLSDLTLEQEVDIDDENKHKVMRTNYLTDVYVQDHRQNKKDDLWVDADLREDNIRYESLDEVQLPVEDCPVVRPVVKKLTGREIQDAIAQAVAESAWERRYRLERPRAEQRITRNCRCKYCGTANPFQTRAYRKRWLVQQGLWTEPEQETIATTMIGEETTTSETPPTTKIDFDTVVDQFSEVVDGAERMVETEAVHGVPDNLSLVGFDMDFGKLSTAADPQNPTTSSIDPGASVDQFTEALDSAGVMAEIEAVNGVPKILSQVGVVKDFGYRCGVTHEQNLDEGNNSVASKDHKRVLSISSENHEESTPEVKEYSDNNDDVLAEQQLQDDASQYQHEKKSKCEMIRIAGENDWSADDEAPLEDLSTTPPIKSRRKRSFLSEVGYTLGLYRVNENDNSTSAKAQRLRREKRRSRRIKHK